ncbi:MAG TPA: hypothetical protein PKZ32_11605 [Candidatus Melainabacteria bacterium]|nr:hypothetical protein [Candidatus Melainabacteria bacterium]
MESSEESVEKPAEKKRESRAFDRAASLLMVTAAALLIGNVVVIWLASMYNEKACLAAVYEAGKACLAGHDQRRIMRAAYLGLSHSPNGGYFIEHPHFTEYHCEDIKGGKKLTIQTSTFVRLPAPMLVVMSKDNLSDDGRLAIHKRFQLDIPDSARN